MDKHALWITQRPLGYWVFDREIYPFYKLGEP